MLRVAVNRVQGHKLGHWLVSLDALHDVPKHLVETGQF